MNSMNELPSDWGRRRREVLERDGGECQIRASDCTLIAVEVDHITPRAKGGSHDISNLRATCRSCHAARARGISNRPLLALSRDWVGI